MSPLLSRLLLLPIALIGSTTARGEPAADEPVLALVRAFSQARATFDAHALDALLTPDYVEVSPVGEVDRRAAVLGFYAPDRKSPTPPMTLAVQDVRRYADTAIVIGSVSFPTPGPNGVAVTREMRVTYVQRRVAKRWLMASAQYTGVRPTRSTP